MSDIINEYGLRNAAVGYFTSAVQLGFILGTLVLSVLTISDRFSPSAVFLISAILGAVFNLSVFVFESTAGVLLSRFLTGVCLAGIYPVGMKIASDYHEKGLGKALGYLVGALVLGTAFPHLIKAMGTSLPWRYVLLCTSAMAIVGGLLIGLFVPNGPYRVKAGKPDFSLFAKLFRNRDFRSAAMGYFGHMWELYTFWAFVPLIIITWSEMSGSHIDTSLWSFIAIAIGSLSCVVGGHISLKKGSAKVAATALTVSMLCCLCSPLLFSMNVYMMVLFLLVWGVSVIADSPQFTTLIAQSVSPTEKGTALTIANAIGFLITVLSIQLLSILREMMDPRFLFLILSVGPVLGLIAFRRHIIKLSSST
ncbi:MAG: MFS transporter [Chitinophagales bacterium]|nr:MFS transporter [Chitinophagales bacterium]